MRISTNNDVTSRTRGTLLIPRDIMVLMLLDNRGDDHNFREQSALVNDVRRHKFTETMR